MGNWDHYSMLAKGVEAWNKWRDKNRNIVPDLSAVRSSPLPDVLSREFPDIIDSCYFNTIDQLNLPYINLSCTNLSGLNLENTNLSYANLRDSYLNRTSLDGATLISADFRGAKLEQVRFQGANLYGANFTGVDLSKVNLNRANLCYANLSGANLSGVYLTAGTILVGANLENANLNGAWLTEADLSEANLSNANLQKANLSRSVLIETNFEHADLTGCSVFGVSAWRVRLKDAKQSNLVITHRDDAMITVDKLEIAQFIYLLVNNEKIRDVITTITSKVVLILGRFTDKRKAVLDAIREEIRKYDYIPVLFDFKKPQTRDIHETVTILARLARFIIADITNPKSIPQELVSIVQGLPSVPVQPIIRYGSKPWAMYDHIERYPWVLEIYKYRNLDDLLNSLTERVISPAESKAKELGVK